MASRFASGVRLVEAAIVGVSVHDYRSQFDIGLCDELDAREAAEGIAAEARWHEAVLVSWGSLGTGAARRGGPLADVADSLLALPPADFRANLGLRLR